MKAIEPEIVLVFGRGLFLFIGDESKGMGIEFKVWSLIDMD